MVDDAYDFMQSVTCGANGGKTLLRWYKEAGSAGSIVERSRAVAVCTMFTERWLRRYAHKLSAQSQTRIASLNEMNAMEADGTFDDAS